jgi:hypothetical protein
VGVGHGAVKAGQPSTDLATEDGLLMVAVDISAEMELKVVDGIGDGTDEEVNVDIASEFDEAGGEAVGEELTKGTDDETVDAMLVEPMVELTEGRSIEEAVEAVGDVEELWEEDDIMETLLVERIELLVCVDEISPFADECDDENRDKGRAVGVDPTTDDNVDELYWVDETTNISVRCPDLVAVLQPQTR